MSHNEQHHEHPEQPGEKPRVRYWRRADGALRKHEGPFPAEQPGWEEITAGEYETALAELQAANDAHVAALQEAEAAQRLADYQALTAVGLPEETARRMSGHTPDPGHGGGD